MSRTNPRQLFAVCACLTLIGALTLISLPGSVAAAKTYPFGPKAKSVAECHEAATGRGKVTVDAFLSCSYAKPTVVQCPKPVRPATDFIKFGNATIVLRPGSRPVHFPKRYTPTDVLNTVHTLCSTAAPLSSYWPASTRAIAIASAPVPVATTTITAARAVAPPPPPTTTTSPPPPPPPTTTTTPTPQGAAPSCQASAHSADNPEYPGDYYVDIESNQPNTEATATTDTNTWSDETNDSGSVDILLYYQTPGEKINVTVGAASCSTYA